MKTSAGWALIGALGTMTAVGLLSGAIAKDPAGLFGSVTAAWVQAIGAISAVLGATWIAGGEAREREARHRAEQHREAVRRYGQALSVGVLLTEAQCALHEYAKPAWGRDRVLQSTAFDKFEEVRTALGNMPIESMGHQRLIEIVVTARLQMVGARPGGAATAIAYARSLADEMQDLAQEVDLLAAGMARDLESIYSQGRG